MLVWAHEITAQCASGFAFNYGAGVRSLVFIRHFERYGIVWFFHFVVRYPLDDLILIELFDFAIMRQAPFKMVGVLLELLC